MAVIKDQGSTAEVGKITISNGDWQALSRIADAYGVKDESDVIAFAIGVFEKAQGGGVIVDTPQGRAMFLPSAKLKKV